jgi:hypothetical protein
MSPPAARRRARLQVGVIRHKVTTLHRFVDLAASAVAWRPEWL